MRNSKGFLRALWGGKINHNIKIADYLLSAFALNGYGESPLGVGFN